MVKLIALLLLHSVSADVCFDNEGVDPAADTAAAAAAAAAAASKAKTLSQDEANAILAEDRRKHQAKLKTLEDTLANTLKDAKLTQQQRDDLEISMADMQKQFMSKEQQLVMDKQSAETKYKTELETERAQRKLFETKFVDSTISRSLTDAAVENGAFRPEQIVALMRSHTKLINDQPVVDFHDKHAETGEAIVVQMTPTAAVKRMKELTDVHGNLFKSNVVSGVGGSSGSTDPGKIDMRKLTPHQYAKLRKENPAALGF